MNVNNIRTTDYNQITYTPKKIPASGHSGKQASNEDSLILSQEAKDFLKNQKTQSAMERKEQYISDLQRFLDTLKNDEENNKENKFLNLSKCMKIASRIQKGHKVPLKDQKFLAENEPELYRMAIMFRENNAHPKKYKSELSDEDEESMEGETNCVESSGAGEGISAATLAEGIE